MRDNPRENYSKILISDQGVLALNKAVLKNPFLTAQQLQTKLSLTASKRTIRRYLNKLGWKKVRTSYCQVISDENKVKRFTFACLVKLYKDYFEDVLAIDECTVELRNTTYKMWNKTNGKTKILRTNNGKIGKHKHNLKVHLFGGVSRKGLCPLVIFEGIMYSKDFQNLLQASVIPFVREKMPYGHRFFMDNDPKHTSSSTRRFMIRNDIRHFPTPAQSPDLMAIEQVWNDLKFYLCKHGKKLKTKADLISAINRFWLEKEDDIEYCNKKFDHVLRAIDLTIALCGRASGL